MSYAEFKEQLAAAGFELHPPEPWWEKARQRSYRPPAEPEGPVKTVISGMSGDQYVVPRATPEDTPGLPAPRRRRAHRRQAFWCEECVRKVGEKEARRDHIHDEKPRYRPPPVTRSQPRDLNSAGKPRTTRKQASQWQGLAGRSTPPSQ